MPISAADQAWSDQYDKAQAAQQAKEQQAKQPPSFLERWTAPVVNATASAVDNAVAEAERWGVAGKRVGMDVNAGLTNMAVGAADTAKAAVTSSGEGLAAAEDPAHAEEALHPPSSPLWDHARSAVLTFRDAMQVQDPGWVDRGTQAMAQFAIPFAGYSRALGGFGRFANWVGSGILADATVQPIDAPRESTADMLALGRHVEQHYLGALGETGGSDAVNGYINFLASNETHTDAEAKFKQLLDSVIPNVAFTGLLLSGGSMLRQGTRAMRYAAENFGTGPLPGSPQAQGGWIGYQGTTAPQFEHYDDNMIGTGEGNAAFGHGHYFAEAEGTGRYYKEMLVRQSGLRGAVMADAAKAVDRAGGRAQAYSELSRTMASEKDPAMRARLKSMMDMVKSGNYERGAGRLDMAEIKDEHINNMLDWDASIRSQPNLQKLISNTDVKIVPEGQNYRVTINGKPAGLYADRDAAMADTYALRGAGRSGEFNASELYRSLSSVLGSQKAASDFLHRRGIPGNIFWDQLSRDGQHGTRNVVAFKGSTARKLTAAEMEAQKIMKANAEKAGAAGEKK